MNRRPNPQKEVDAWNARVKVGDAVSYVEVKGMTEPQTFKTKTEAAVLSGHTAVVWLEGKRGCVAVSHCTPFPPDREALIMPIIETYDQIGGAHVGTTPGVVSTVEPAWH